MGNGYPELIVLAALKAAWDRPMATAAYIHLPWVPYSHYHFVCTLWHEKNVGNHWLRDQSGYPLVTWGLILISESNQTSQDGKGEKTALESKLRKWTGTKEPIRGQTLPTSHYITVLSVPPSCCLDGSDFHTFSSLAQHSECKVCRYPLAGWGPVPVP